MSCVGRAKGPSACLSVFTLEIKPFLLSIDCELRQSSRVVPRKRKYHKREQRLRAKRMSEIAMRASKYATNLEFHVFAVNLDDLCGPTQRNGFCGTG